MMTDQTNNVFSVEDLCELAKLEGDLLVVAAFERLDIGTQPDEDNFTDNQWTIASLARTFARGCAGDLPRYAHPSCKVLFDEVIELARTVCPGTWDHFFKIGLDESLAMAAMD
ncbi:hypothetical protein ACF5DM_001410 [Salmonella enterica]|uniref:Uncharacterized protein n=1 Tax=Salmonella enterica I TaxID=59201 RepID=A0A3Z3VBT6_SALET|nr:hypothetical protein [Salmonella enterica]EAB9926974.1 hypothetical protein [Salmonella enterica subsp. enterica serovar Kua]EBF8098473.1 hypothetical protein [Salmonella enterica subsp. enterica serovar Nigeria]EBG0215148.1 hypothetical protein [Salmonella enterica subsp. enterica serovar Louisiana]EBG8221503.1 hypothetical protein [Salmonella enterica subsp. enterica]EBR8050723.1 hypothetical protein [Salmonella enterica subsp. enterica serovar Altona]EBS2725001.1 hypothetical protein [S